MPNGTDTQPQGGGYALDFSVIPIEYWMIISIMIFLTIILGLLYLFRGTPMIFAKANYSKKDVLLINLGNDRLVAAIPTVVAGWFHIKGDKKKGGLGGYFYISPKSILRFGNTGVAFANAHQAMTIPLPTTEVMTNLQKEEQLGLQVDAYSDIDVIVKYGEYLETKESTGPLDKIKDVVKRQNIEELELKFAALVERMKNLDHLTPLTIKPDLKKGEKAPPRIFTNKDVEVLGRLIAQSKTEGFDLLKHVSKDDLKVLSKAQGQMIRGQTSALRGIRGFLDERLKAPHPRVIENLIEDALTKMQKAQEFTKMLIIGVILLIGAGIGSAVIFMIITSSA